jgi:release factor glutamine methyltransferase
MKAVRAKLAKLLPFDRFEKAEIDWILCEVLGVKRSALAEIKFVDEEAFKKAEAFAKERATGKPLQYVLGNTEFYGYKINVNSNVLIPRPETELLAERVILEAEGKKVLDLCTGSGAIAIAVALESRAEVTASDISEEALKVAEDNAKLNGANIKFVNSDMFKNISEKYDIIVSNPPYIPSKDIDGLQTEVKDYEPKTALNGGDDGLDFYRIIAAEAREYLTETGCIMLEFGVNQELALRNIFEGFDLTVISDYQNIPRILIVRQEAICLKN